MNRSLQRYPGKFLFSKEGFRWLAELEQVYAEAGFELAPPSAGEKRVAKGNKASVTRSRNALASP